MKTSEWDPLVKDQSIVTTNWHGTVTCAFQCSERNDCSGFLHDDQLGTCGKTIENVLCLQGYVPDSNKIYLSIFAKENKTCGTIIASAWCGGHSAESCEKCV